MRILRLILLVGMLSAVSVMAQNPTSCRITSPNGGEVFRPGISQTITWDTAGTSRARWRFKYGTSPAGPWTTITGMENVLDSAARRGTFVGGWRVPAQATTNGYIRMELVADSVTVFDVTDAAFTIIQPEAVRVDSVLSGILTGTVKLRNSKIYGLNGFLYVNGTLEIEPGTIIVGDTVGQNSAICVNRGGKIIAKGTKDRPIIFTSAAPAGQRARGDWGGIVLCGNARTNHPGGQAAMEGGIADPAPPNGWFGGTDDNDNSGVLQYVRIEFGGIALTPNNEINGLTMCAVGRGTTIDHVQVSHANDDSFEWFGGTVNAKYLIAFGGIDDDFDTDNGFSGMVQYGVGKRFRTIADQSTSQAFESDNDANTSYNNPRTSCIFSNMTLIGPIQDTSWTAGSGPNQYNRFYGAGMQVRRNSRFNLFNSVFVGWPRGMELSGVPTMTAAQADTTHIRHNSWFGIKGTTFNLASGTPPTGMDVTWLERVQFVNLIDKSNPNNAFLENPWVESSNTFNPAPKSSAPYLNSASFTNANFALVPINDPFFEQVSYRGAFPATGERWDEGWTEYDPVNADYRAIPFVKVLSPGATAGEKYLKGANVSVTWDTTNAPGAHYKVEFATGAAGPWTTVTNGSDVVDAGASRGMLPGGFTVPNINTTTGYIRISDVSDASNFDINDNPFSIIDLPQPAVRLIEPGTNTKSIRVGQSVTLNWDTTNTYRKHWRFEYGMSTTGPWRTLSNLGNVLDSGARRGQFIGAFVLRQADITETGYVRMTLLEDTTKTDVNDQPFAVVTAAPSRVDSVISGHISTRVKLWNTKIYGIDGFVYIDSTGVLEIEKGTIILGDTLGQNNAICVNRGGKLVANGTRDLPIVFTSGAAPGQRARGDWGGIVFCGRARTNHPGGQAAMEGGIADPAPPNGWFGGTNDDDSSGVLRYVRIEFAGIALTPNNEINGLTLAGVGRKTVIDHVQVSHANDDSFEWFGGTVNAKYLIAYGGIDDDFDTDNGFSGKVQFGLGKRFRTIADQSTSQAFESDNDANTSFNNPRTSCLFSNMTLVGPVQDTSWTSGNGPNQYNRFYGAGIQVRRNSRHNLFNSVFTGWPRGMEIAGVPTMNAANADTMSTRNNSWFGIKGTWLNLAGGTPPAGMDAAWISKPAFNNTIDKADPNSAMLINAWVENDNAFNPAPLFGASYLNNASFTNGTAFAPIGDPFFEQVAYRGAFAPNGERWDAIWAEYDPINKEYKAQPPVLTSVQDDNVTEQVVASVYPNPTADVCTVRYRLSGDDAITIAVVNALGSERNTFMVAQPQKDGVYEFQLHTSTLATGMYFVTFTTSRGTVSLPLTVQR
ncbi:hypothetical protein BH10BAC6_BH10BAC6_07480 [soil metagenome]